MSSYRTYRHVAQLGLDDTDLPASAEPSFGVGTVLVDLRQLLGEA
ncbi:hypothetical protein [Cryptosporangium aurantiacum]|nr:hypothetical protein [Cryptosporangium aurantiacum]